MSHIDYISRLNFIVAFLFYAGTTSSAVISALCGGKYDIHYVSHFRLWYGFFMTKPTSQQECKVSEGVKREFSSWLIFLHFLVFLYLAVVSEGVKNFLKHQLSAHKHTKYIFVEDLDICGLLLAKVTLCK